MTDTRRIFVVLSDFCKLTGKTKSTTLERQLIFSVNYIANGSSWSDHNAMKTEDGQNGKGRCHLKQTATCEIRWKPSLPYRNCHHIFLKEFSKLFKKQHSGWFRVLLIPRNTIISSNWTKWSAIQGVITLNKSTARHWFEITTTIRLWIGRLEFQTTDQLSEHM